MDLDCHCIKPYPSFPKSLGSSSSLGAETFRYVIPFPRIMVPPATQLGGSSPPKVSYCQSPPAIWDPLFGN